MERSGSSATTGGDLSWYIHEIRKLPMLGAELERGLCHRWRDHHDISAAHQLAVNYQRLVVKTATDYQGYGLPFEELVGEGHVGLMRAVCRFDPDTGIRFANYAIWRVRAAIQEHILRNWSVVKMGTTASRKRLFFNLRRTRSRLQKFDDSTLQSKHVSRITIYCECRSAR